MKTWTLAKQAAEDGVVLNVSPLYSDHYGVVRDQYRVIWQEYFDKRSREKGIWYKAIQPQIVNYPWINDLSLDRNLLKHC